MQRTFLRITSKAINTSVVCYEQLNAADLVLIHPTLGGDKTLGVLCGESGCFGEYFAY